MKSFIILAVCVAAAVAVPTSYSSGRDAYVVKQTLNNIGVDGYDFAYETSDGSSRQEEASLKNVGTENEALVVRGQYSYIGPDNLVYTVTYVADENGYRATADHLPQAPSYLTKYDN